MDDHSQTGPSAAKPLTEINMHSFEGGCALLTLFLCVSSVSRCTFCAWVSTKSPDMSQQSFGVLNEQQSMLSPPLQTLGKIDTTIR